MWVSLWPDFLGFSALTKHTIRYIQKSFLSFPIPITETCFFFSLTTWCVYHCTLPDIYRDVIIQWSPNCFCPRHSYCAITFPGHLKSENKPTLQLEKKNNGTRISYSQTMCVESKYVHALIDHFHSLIVISSKVEIVVHYTSFQIF